MVNLGGSPVTEFKRGDVVFIENTHQSADLNIIFCKEETSGDLIKEILYRDLKERLERCELG